MPDLPSGTVTFLFADVEQSTAILERIGDERYSAVQDDRRRLLRGALEAGNGVEIDARADELFAAFARAKDAITTAVSAQQSIATHRWPDGVELRIRIGVHTGEPALRDDGYLGIDVHRAARICAAGHGGQIVVSQTTYDLLAGFELGGIELTRLGEHVLDGLSRPERLYQVRAPDLPATFPALRASHPAGAFAGREPELAARAQSAVRGRRLLARAFLPSKGGPPGLADLGWEVRRLLPVAAPSMREGLAALARDLFDAARTTADVDRYLDGIDRKGMTRRFREHQELGVISRRAATVADSYGKQIEDIEALVDLRKRSVEVQRDLASALASPVDEATFAHLSGLARDLNRDLAAGLDRARNEIGFMSARLRRTPYRGVYRHGLRYVVPFFDETGVEHRQPFDSLRQARDFRRALTVKEKTDAKYIDFLSVDHDEFGFNTPKQTARRTGRR